MEKPKIFISWSGQRAQFVASKLSEWLSKLLGVHTWMSEHDILPGEQWRLKLSEELNSSNYSIICLTETNLVAPWLIYEAGAIGKRFKEAKVCPYLIGVSTGNLPGPLSLYQAREASFEGTWSLVEGINKDVGENVDVLHDVYENQWVDLKKVLDHVQYEGIPLHGILGMDPSGPV